MNIQGAVAIVTGGASGLGLATARRLIDEGAIVVALDLPGSDRPTRLAALGSSAHFFPCDVTQEAGVIDAVEYASRLGTLRIVVNCAGIVTPGKLLGRKGPLNLAMFNRVVGVNLSGTVNVMAHAANKMSEAATLGEERGVIVNTASVAAFDGQVGQIAYAASKGAIAALTLPAAREMADHAIRVLAIAPGTFETPMIASLPQAAQDSLSAQVPHPSRLGKPDEFAALVVHILENPMLNGEVIRIDGAIRMAPR